MRVLLVFPTVEGAPKGNPQPPLGIAYIASYLESQGHETRIVDMYSHGTTINGLLSEIAKFRPELVGFSVLTLYMNSVGKFAKKIKAKFPEVKILVGNVHPSGLPVKTLKGFPEIDFVCIGEGELTTAELCRAIGENRELDKVDGIAFRKKGRVVLTKPRARIENLDSLPFPAWHLLDMETYLRDSSSRKSFSIITTRGCFGTCTYCDQAVIWRRQIRARSPENVVAELKHLKENYGLGSFIIQDDSFTINKERIHLFCDMLEKEKLAMPWAAKARVDLVDLPLLQHMKKAGCEIIRYGIESGSQKILDDVKKRITLARIREAVNWTKQAGILVGTFWMVGFPNETREDVKKTFELAKELDPDATSMLAVLVPFPTTPIYMEAKEAGLILSENWDSYWIGSELNKHQRPLVRTKYLTAGQLIQLKEKYDFRLASMKRAKFLKKQFKRLPRIFLNFFVDPVHFLRRARRIVKKELVIERPSSNQKAEF